MEGRRFRQGALNNPVQIGGDDFSATIHAWNLSSAPHSGHGPQCHVQMSWPDRLEVGWVQNQASSVASAVWTETLRKTCRESPCQTK